MSVVHEAMVIKVSVSAVESLAETVESQRSRQWSLGFQLQNRLKYFLRIGRIADLILRTFAKRPNCVGATS